MKVVLCVFALLVGGTLAGVPRGYMYYQPGTQGIMYVQYQKPGVESHSNGVSAFVAGEAGNTMSIVYDLEKKEDSLSEYLPADQDYASHSIAQVFPADESAPVNRNLQPVTDHILSQIPDNGENAPKDGIEKRIADEVSAFGNEVVPVAIADSDITNETSVTNQNEENHEITDEKQFQFYGAPDLEIAERQPKHFDENFIHKHKTIDANEETPIIKDIHIPEIPVVPSRKPRVFINEKPNTNKVFVQLDKEDDEITFNLKKEDDDEGSSPPLSNGIPFFPINFGNTNGGAIAIANSFSTGKGGSSHSHAVAYGTPRESLRSKKNAKEVKLDCDY